MEFQRQLQLVGQDFVPDLLLLPVTKDAVLQCPDRTCVEFVLLMRVTIPVCFACVNYSSTLSVLLEGITVLLHFLMYTVDRQVWVQELKSELD